MESVAQNQRLRPDGRPYLPAQPHHIIDGVTYKRCTGKYGCGNDRRVDDQYWDNPDYEDGKDCTCVPCRKARKALRKQVQAIEQPETTAIVPSRVVKASVNGCELLATFVDAEKYWPAKPAVEAVGLNWPAQEQRIKRDARLAQGICIMHIPTAGGHQEMICLPWSSWHYFWVGVTDKVKESARPQVERIKDEAHAALAAAFGDTAETVLSGVSQYDQLLHTKIDRVSRLTEDIHATLRGATKIDRERKVPVIITGYVYFASLYPDDWQEVRSIDMPDAPAMWNAGFRLVTIGQTKKETAKARLTEYAKKLRLKCVSEITAFGTDRPLDAETFVRQNTPLNTKRVVGSKDVFWVKPAVIDILRDLPRYIAYTDLVVGMRGWKMLPTSQVIYGNQEAWL